MVYKKNAFSQGTTDLSAAVELLFAAYYSFNELFPKNAVRTLEFIQRRALKINNKEFRAARQISSKLMKEFFEFIVDTSDVLQ